MWVWEALVGRFASLGAAWAASVGIITFFKSVCAAAAWPLAIVNLMMFGYVSSAAAGIAAFLVLHRVLIRVSAAAARLSALLGVILRSGCSGACSAKVKSVWLLLGVLPRVAFGYVPLPSFCEWDASCQSVPGFGYPTLGFFFSAAAAFIVTAIVIMLWKCCSLWSGSCKEWKKESLSKLVEKTDSLLFLQVASWFTAVVMASCNCVWAALVCNVVANHSVLEEGMFIVDSATDKCRRTSLCFHLATFAILSILSSPGFELLCGHVLGLRQPQFAAACTGAFVGLLALVGVLSYAFEGLDRHVLAGSLFSGTGEQASGRVDVPGKDNQQQAAAAKGTPFICFFVKSLGGASHVVKLEHHATVARVKQHVALKSGVCVDAFYLVREGKVLRDDDMLGCLGVVQGTQLHMCCSYLRGGVGMGRQPQIPGQWVCQSCGMGGCWPTRQSCCRCGAPRQGGIGGQRPPREAHYPGQPSNQGLPIILQKRVLRGFNGGNGQSPPKVVPTGPLPSSNQCLADPTMLLPLLQSLGLPEEVLEAVRARLAAHKAPKKVSREKQPSLLRAKIDVVAPQIARLNKAVLHHQEKLRESEDALSTKQSEHAQLQVEFRELTDKGFTPTPSPIPAPPQSDHGGEEGEACGEESVPDVPMEHTSSDSGAAGDAARPVAGEAVLLVGRCSQ